jgi:homoserine kinase type II
VLEHVDRRGGLGFGLPVAVRTCAGGGFVSHDGHLWELTAWLPGRNDFDRHSCAAKVQNALAALAAFHVAAATHGLADPSVAPPRDIGSSLRAESSLAIGPSPGIAQRRTRLEHLLSGDLRSIADSIPTIAWPELESRARRVIELFPRAAPDVRRRLGEAVEHRVPLQPCIRDVWRDNVLFDGDRVAALVDFGAMRVDNVSTDIARLLGSLAGDDEAWWKLGMDAYQTVRPITVEEAQLVAAFDRSGVLLSGVQWIDWVCRQRRHFPDPGAVLRRLDEILGRLARSVAPADDPAFVGVKPDLTRCGGLTTLPPSSQ